MSTIVRWGRQINESVIEVGWDGRLVQFQKGPIRKTAKCALTGGGIRRGEDAYSPVGDALAHSVVLSVPGVGSLSVAGRMVV